MTSLLEVFASSGGPASERQAQVDSFLNELHREDARRLSALLRKHPRFLSVHEPIAGSAAREPYLLFSPDVFLIKGAARYAIYDLDQGQVYSLSPALGGVLDRLQKGARLPELLRTHPDGQRTEVERAIAFLIHLGMARLSSVPGPAERGLPRSPLRLERLFLELTGGCNLTCVHCYSTSSPGKISHCGMDQLRWSNVLTEGAALGCKEVIFTGGEPLLLGDDLFGLLEHAKTRGYEFIEVHTNATLLKPHQIGHLRDLGVQLSISYYSSNESVHDTVTRSRRSLQRLQDNLHALRDGGVPFRINLIIMRANLAGIEQTIEYLRNTFVPRRIDCNFTYSVGRGAAVDHLTEATVNRRTITREIRAPVFPQITRTEFVKRISGHSCWAGELCISPEGTVTPCPFERDIVLGTVLDEPLHDIVAHPRTRALWSLTKDKIEGCKDCEYRYACFDCRPAASSPGQGCGTGCGSCAAGCGTPSGLHSLKMEPGTLTRKPGYCHYDPLRGVWPEARLDTHEQGGNDGDL